MKKEKCPDCVLELEAELLAAHTREQCLTEQLRVAKLSIESWKDAWFKQREATGTMAWTVPNPWYLMPCSAKHTSAFFQNQYDIFVKFARELLAEIDKPAKEVTMRTYTDPFDSVEE